MSRVRNVKGHITEIVGGDYKMYSASDIVESATDKFHETAGGGFFFGEPADPPLPPDNPAKTKIEGKALVNFRPHNNWGGEFGFDWLRVGDTGRGGDVWYRDIIGEYSRGAFVRKYSEYIRLGRMFEMREHPTKAGDKYVVPVLTILPGKEAKLSLKVEITEADIQSIEFKYNADYFSLNQEEIWYKTVGKKTLPDYLTIKCIKEFAQTQYIEVLADGKFAGRLKILANDKDHRYKARILFVNVTTRISIAPQTGKTLRGQALFTKFLHQSLIKASFSQVPLDISNDVDFNKKFSRNGKLIDADRDDFQDYLIEKLKNAYKKDYSKYYKIFLIDEDDSVGGLYGRAYGIPSQKRSVVVLRPGLNDSTLAHETFHAMGLYHSFSNRGLFTFEQDRTDNIMDYSDMGPLNIPVISTWQWQWYLLHQNLQKE